MVFRKKAAGREQAEAAWPAQIADFIEGRAEAIVRSLVSAVFVQAAANTPTFRAIVFPECGIVPMRMRDETFFAFGGWKSY